MIKRVILTGGGTGGHIYPALAIASAIREQYPQAEFAYIGKKSGMEAKILAKRDDISFYGIDVQGFSRKKLLSNFKTISNFFSASTACKRYIKNFNPDIVIGTGGYVSAPAVYTAYRLKIPTLIHEQNLIPGLTTKALGLVVNVVATSFECCKIKRAKRVVFTGNPRSSEVIKANNMLGRKELRISSFSPVVLIMGGSLGAKNVNKVFIDFFKKNLMGNVEFIYVTGDLHYDKVVAELMDANISNIKLYPFIYDIPNILAATDVVVARAGATTLAEITALGIPSILIPSPYVTNNHQEHNARMLEKEGAAKVILEKELTVEKLHATLNQIINNKELNLKMQKAAKSLAIPDAAERIVKEVEKILDKKGCK